MTNGEKYKTAQERAEAFGRFCDSFGINCHGCPVADDCSMKGDAQGAFAWLDLEAEDEKPLPCPFCGGEAKETANFGGVHFVMCDCGYSSTETSDKESAIAAHNRVAKAVAESEAK